MEEIIYPRGGRGQIIPLSEGSFTIDKTKLFVPFDEDKDDLQTRSSGSLLVEVQPFVIVNREDILLLDTGLGFANGDGTLQIHQNLRNVGIDPRQVTKILISHLHKDHAGGVCLQQDHSKLSFPEATYFLQQRELQFAFEKGFPSFIPEELEVLRNSPQIKLLTDHVGTIGDSIHYQVTAAHSPFHQVFWIRKEGQIIFFGGDDAPQLQQMKHRFVAKYDYNGKKASQLRKQWWQKGLEEKWIFLFYHDIKTPMYVNEE